VINIILNLLVVVVGDSNPAMEGGEAKPFFHLHGPFSFSPSLILIPHFSLRDVKIVCGLASA